MAVIQMNDQSAVDKKVYLAVGTEDFFYNCVRNLYSLRISIFMRNMCRGMVMNGVSGIKKSRNSWTGSRERMRMHAAEQNIKICFPTKSVFEVCGIYLFPVYL